jgi:hypothetical protein
MVVLALALGACASGPPPPDWQANAQLALERSTAAYLVGNARVETAEFDRARSEISRTGRVELRARAELVRCAARVASLVFEPCAGFEAVRADAPPAERAYAGFLTGRVSAESLPLLPAQHRPAAAALSAALSGNTDAARSVQEMADPLARLVAAGVLLQAGRASPALVTTGVDTASAQGWRRPLLAWLGVQATQAEKAGSIDEAQRIRRRIQQVLEGP